MYTFTFNTVYVDAESIPENVDRPVTLIIYMDSIYI